MTDTIDIDPATMELRRSENRDQLTAIAEKCWDRPEQPAEKSEGQLVLERLLAVSAHMSIVGSQLDSLKHAIGLPVAGCAGSAPAGGREVSQFLPALRLLADRMEEQLTSIDGSVNDIAKAF
ncbi:hypothetical protein LOC51_00645 [Rubrivivax sp. JA1024]|nr:hypothetical protein [Rubrivivax sp. JA1024]